MTRTIESERWQRIKEVVHGALEREAADRIVFLDEACVGDEPLRREVESLLDSHEQAEGFFMAAALEDVAKIFVSEHAESMVGQRIGAYALINEIGRGGMGVVYLAERADDQFQKRVAIKLIKRGMDTDSVLRRFRYERQILASLDHPNIARLIDGGTTEDELPYFVMEYVEGMRIDVYADAGELSIDARLKLFRSVCSAVSYAHQNLVIHRDIKPSNILVTPVGTPKLLDFGIAKILNPDMSAETIDQTASALRLMTPEYASPEQIKGEPITASTDVYSLGVLLYELLSGHRPYRVKARPRDEIHRIICNEEPEKPSTAFTRVEEVRNTDDADPVTITPESVSKSRGDVPSSLRRRLSGDLDNIVLKAMRKAPERRYESVEQFSEDICRHQQGLPIIARKDTPLYRVTKFVRRKKTGAVVSLLMVLAILILNGMGLYWFMLREPAAQKPIQSIAVLPLSNLSGDPAQDYFADGMTEALITQLAQVSGLRVISRTSIMRYTETRPPLPEIARQLGVDTVVEGSILRTGERLQVSLKMIQAATEQPLWARTYERDMREATVLQSEMAQAIVQEIQVKLTPHERARLTSTRAVNREAYEAYLKGRHHLNKGEKGWQKAVDYFTQAISIDSNYAGAHAGLAQAYVLSANRPPREVLPKAKEAAQKALALDETLAEAHVASGVVKYYYDWDWRGAEEEFKRAIVLNPGDVSARAWYGWCLIFLKRWEESLAQLRRAQELDPLSLDVNRDIGAYFYYTRQYDQAIDQLQKTLELDPNYVRAHFWLMGVYRLKGMYGEAIAELQKTYGSNPNGTEFQAHLAFIYALNGKRNEAKRILDAMIKRSEHEYIPSYSFAYLHFAVGDKDQAFAWFEKAYEERQVWLPSLNVDPALHEIREDPRFIDLARRMGLPQ